MTPSHGSHPPFLDIPLPGDWANEARCATIDIETIDKLFFVENQHTTSRTVIRARAICRKCPVINDCREYALTYPKLMGIWGGLTRRQRDALREERRKSA